MSERRWNPILQEWVITATHRQERPQMPKDWCPFCPGSGKVPEHFDVLLYPNDFPSLSTPPPEEIIQSSDLYKVEESYGVCDVVLYHPDHQKSFAELSLDHIEKIIKLWIQRFNELAEDSKLKYIFIFENKGEVIGVTMPHPHGQIYAFPFISPKIQTKVNSAKGYFEKENKCLFCKVLETEIQFAKRIIWQDQHFAAFIPFYARYPYEVHIYPKRHLQYLHQMNEAETSSFAKTLKIVTNKYDNLFGFSFPYMKMLFQAPINCGEQEHWHFHLEFNPPYRSRNKLKYLASCESGTGSFINDTAAEEKALELIETAPTKI